MRLIPTSSDAKRRTGGKITVAAMLSVALVVVTTFGGYFEISVPHVGATAVSTSLTVLNTPPSWTVTAQESTASATSTPTNAGYTLAFTATATDSSNDNYWLLICSASSTPVGNVGAAPTCGGGIQWAVSASTASASVAYAATTTIATAPFNAENNAWYAYICDGNVTGPACNPVMSQGGPGGTASPFVIDHPPIFSNITNSGTVYPGGTETWTSTATTTDLLRGGDTIRLWVCKTNVFNGATSTNPCAGGTWATSTLATFNPATSTTIVIPTQDANYGAYAFIANQFGLVATSTFQGTNSWFHVMEVAPTISAANITLVDQSGSGSTLRLTTPGGKTSGYKVTFQVTDYNGCLNASSTNQIASTTANVYRSGVTQAACLVSNDYNSNQCYPAANPYSQMVCTQDVQTCTAQVTNINFTCTFPLWYNADPTDGVTPHNAENWVASVQANAYFGIATSSALVESTLGSKDLESFLAFSMATTSISYGGLQPGQSNSPLATTTDLQEQGNTGIDETLYGSTMCTAPTWNYPTNPDPDQCDIGGANAGTKIPVLNQQMATSSGVAYGTAGRAFALTASSSPYLLGIHVQKTTATSSPNNKSTWWGILVPGTITQAGNYFGQNTVTALVSSSTNW